MISATNSAFFFYKSQHYNISDTRKKLLISSAQFLPDITPKMVEDESKMCAFLDITPEKLDVLKSLCDPELINFSYKNETEFFSFSKDDVSDVPLDTIQRVNSHDSKRDAFIYQSTLIYSRQFISSTKNPSDIIETGPTCEPNVVMNKEFGSDVYLLMSIRKSDEKKSVLTEVMVSSKTRLEDLKDIICCPLTLQNPYGQDPKCQNMSTDHTFKDEFPNCLFLINGTVYEHNSIIRENPSYGEKIVQFYLENPRKYPIHMNGIKYQHMKDVTLDSLTIALGVPYLFSHFYTCEHVIVFKDIRIPKLWERHLNSYSSSYNRTIERLNNYFTYVSKPVLKFCNICKQRLAVCATRQDLMALDDPFQLCGDCFNRLHIDDFRNVIGHFLYYSIKN